MEIEQVDFVTVPTRDPERARAFYHETLELPLDPNNEREVTAAWAMGDTRPERGPQ